MAAIAAAIGRGSVAGVVISAGKRAECGVMRNIMILAGILVGLGTSMAQIADRITPALAHTSAETPPSRRWWRRPAHAA